MRKHSVLAGLCLAFLGSAAAAQDTVATDALAAAMRGTAVPAMAVLEMRDGQVVHEAARGVRRNDGADAVRVDDVWLIGSDAKSMTAALIARLVDRKVLSWTTPLSQLLPAVADKMRPAYRGVTLEQLLSHHAGLPHDASDEAFFQTLFHDKRPLLEATNPDMFAPAGNMAMSLRDWSAFCLDQMAGAEGRGKLLSAPAYRRMQSAQPGGGSAGLGWGIQATLGGHAGPVWVHAGSDGTGYAMVALFPKTRRGLLVVANASDEMGGAKATRDVMMALMKSYP